jgi:N-methylhydantoinase B/oxoprolinase/acetone carboxylase alpha subunit
LIEKIEARSLILQAREKPMQQIITKSAILYCLKSLIGQGHPLNSGVLTPFEIIIPTAPSSRSPKKQQWWEAT